MYESVAVSSCIMLFLMFCALKLLLITKFSRFDVASSDHFQHSIDALTNSNLSWGLKMNAVKCIVTTFCSDNSVILFSGTSPYHINGSPIHFISSHSDLGITVDKNLKFHSHISKEVAMANSITTNL